MLRDSPFVIRQGKGTALHHATNSGHPEVVAILLEKGADPNAQDNRGERPGDRFDPEVRQGAAFVTYCSFCFVSFLFVSFCYVSVLFVFVLFCFVSFRVASLCFKSFHAVS